MNRLQCRKPCWKLNKGIFLKWSCLCRKWVISHNFFPPAAAQPHTAVNLLLEVWWNISKVSKQNDKQWWIEEMWNQATLKPLILFTSFIYLEHHSAKTFEQCIKFISFLLTFTFFPASRILSFKKEIAYPPSPSWRRLKFGSRACMECREFQT